MIPNDLYIWKLICCVFLNKREVFVSFLWKILHFLIFFHVPKTFWWLLNFERYVHVYLCFRCIFLICSCHLGNHPSILWTILYPSPDDGYYNRNVNVDFTSWYIHLFGLYVFPATFIYIYIYMREREGEGEWLYIYIYNLCAYEGHSIDIVNFAFEIGHWKHGL